MAHEEFPQKNNHETMEAVPSDLSRCIGGRTESSKRWCGSLWGNFWHIGIRVYLWTPLAFTRAGKGIKLRFFNVQFSCHIWFVVFGDVIRWNLQDGYITCERCGKVHTLFTDQQSRHWQEPFCMVSLWKLSTQRSQNDAVDVLFGCSTWSEEKNLVQSIDDRYTAACL